MRSQAYAYATLLYPVYSRLGIQRITYLRHSRLFDIIEKKLQFITLLTAIVHCFTHRKQQKLIKVILLRA